jgi:hypothetical protein
MTTAEEKRRGKGSAVLAVFAGATIGAVGWRLDRRLDVKRRSSRF